MIQTKLHKEKGSTRLVAVLTILTLVLSITLTPATRTQAADHGDGPAVSNDRQADIGDVYAFLDPNDNSRVVVVMTTQGFIVPGEAVNFGIFDHNLRYRFELETTGDAIVDQVIDVTFTEKAGAAGSPQIGSVVSSFFPAFSGNSTVPNLSANSSAPVVTTSNAGVSFCAGVFDDPFFFDIPGFSRFVGSVLGGNPDLTTLQRGRDSFAGYGTMAIALSIPTSLILPRLSNTAGTTIGVAGRVARRSPDTRGNFPFRGLGRFIHTDVDRVGNPAVNTALVPFSRRNEYNTASTLADAQGRFASSIVGTLQALGTTPDFINVLAGVAVLKGDFLRLNLNLPNTGNGGGNNAGAGFPNGRRLGDDVIDTILTLVANGTPLGDNVNANDATFRDSFPFLANPAQPFAPGTVDDRTRN